MQCTISLVDEVNVYIEGLEPALRRELNAKFSYEIPGARYRPGARLGRSVAKQEFFHLNGSTYFYLLPEIIEVLDKHGVEIDIVDYRTNHPFELTEITDQFLSDVVFPPGHHLEGQPVILREHQVDAVNKLLQNRHGTLLASTSSGKTLICAALVKSVEQFGRTVTIVPSTDLVQQTFNDYDLMKLDCGMFWAEQKDFDKTHIITTWQSLNVLKKATKKGEIPITEEDLFSLFDGVVAIIVDEAHTSAADALFDTLSSPDSPCSSVPIRWAMTGTMPKDKIMVKKIECNVGGIVHKITAKDLMDRGVLSTCNVNCISTEVKMTFKDYASELKYLTTDVDRLEYIASMIKDVSQTGNTLVLVDRIECGEILCEFLGIPKKEFVRGATKKSDREASYGEIRWQDNKILIATYGVASTGISISRLYNVFMIEPGKSFVRTIQSIGRGLRKAEDKDHVEIFDISSTTKFSAKHARERIKYYKESEYPHQKLKIKDWQK